MNVQIQTQHSEFTIWKNKKGKIRNLSAQYVANN